MSDCESGQHEYQLTSVIYEGDLVRYNSVCKCGAVSVVTVPNPYRDK